MIRGFESFKEWFKGYEDGYVIIGGTACDLIMSEVKHGTPNSLFIVIVD